MWGRKSIKNLAIDLGNNNTLIADQSAILLAQPSFMVVNEESNRVEAVGDKAYEMLEKTHAHLKPIKPLRGGVISDGESARRMLRELVNKIDRPAFFGRRYHYLLSGIPFDTTAVEQRALRDALDQFSSRNTHLVYEPLAAAMGMGLDIRQPEGKMIIDIGGGITEVVVISLSGIAAFQSLRVAGDKLDEEIQDHFRRVYNMAIGLKTAEKVKKSMGCVFAPIATAETVMVKGKDLLEGIPVSQKISQQELTQVLERPFRQIEESILQSLEVCPPELASDIYQSGIYVTGGSAQLKGVRERFSKTFKLKVNIDPESLLSVSKGVGKILNAPKCYRSVLM